MRELRYPRSIAPAVTAKNIPPGYFLNAATVLKEITKLYCYTDSLRFVRRLFLSDRGFTLFEYKNTADTQKRIGGFAVQSTVISAVLRLRFLR